VSDTAVAGISRQTGLLKELNVIANNMANASTVGFKREASVFTEYVEARGDQPSVSLASLRGHYPVLSDGSYAETGATFDFALIGEGFFAVETPSGMMLTRNGSFQLNPDGQLITSDGHAVLDEGGGTIDIPPEAEAIVVAPDGTVSIDGLAQARLGVFSAPEMGLVRTGDNLWKPTEGYQFVDTPQIRQGYLEQSNVNPIMEMARLIEAQRLFEAGQSILDQNDSQIRELIRATAARS